jgi:hypothetical protein
MKSLFGMGLLEEYELEIEGRYGGLVKIRALPYAKGKVNQRHEFSCKVLL